MKYENPNVEYIIKNFKKLSFYKKNYLNADLLRICDIEEIVQEWYELDLNDKE